MKRLRDLQGTKPGTGEVGETSRGSAAAIPKNEDNEGLSAIAYFQVTMSMRKLWLSLLPVTHRWPPMSRLYISERVLPTLSRH